MIVSALCANVGLTEFVEFDIGELHAADDALLRLGRQRVPSRKIVQILLRDHVAAACERLILRRR